MKAFDFLYDGRTLSSFGMVICNFDSKGVNTVSNGSVITFNTASTFNGTNHHLTSVEYNDCLETTIQICKNYCSSDVKEITSTEMRELTKWLNRKKFLKFKILDDDYIDLFFEASFNINRIEFEGAVYGLELEVKTNRPFALKEPETIVIQTRYCYTWEKFNVIDNGRKGESTGKYVNSYNRNFYPDNGMKNNYYYTYVGETFENEAEINDSSYEEGYIYPYTEIVVLKDGDLNIYNAIENRNTYIANCIAGEVITMEYPVISSSVSSHNIQNDFNWNFFRVANTYENSRNDLTISLPCTIKIKYSPIVKVGL
mgnify:CR=1 FL=1